jgi:hypothetical protein
MITNMPKLQTNEQLRKISCHLAYEVEMITWTAGILNSIASLKGLDSNDLIRGMNNGLVESFAIHFRVLRDFLYYRPHGNDNVVVEDYVDDQTLSRLRPQESRLLNGAWCKATKEVVHLSRDRVLRSAQSQAGQHRWDSVAIAGELLRVLAAVAGEINASKLAPGVKEKLTTRPTFPKFRVQLQDDRAGNPEIVIATLPQGSPSAGLASTQADTNATFAAPWMSECQVEVVSAVTTGTSIGSCSCTTSPRRGRQA